MCSAFWPGRPTAQPAIRLGQKFVFWVKNSSNATYLWTDPGPNGGALWWRPWPSVAAINRPCPPCPMFVVCVRHPSKTTCFGIGPGPGALSGPGPQKSQNGKIFMKFSQSRHINRISVLGHFKAFGCQGRFWVRTRPFFKGPAEWPGHPTGRLAMWWG